MRKAVNILMSLKTTTLLFCFGVIFSLNLNALCLSKKVLERNSRLGGSFNGSILDWRSTYKFKKTGRDAWFKYKKTGKRRGKICFKQLKGRFSKNRYGILSEVKDRENRKVVKNKKWYKKGDVLAQSGPGKVNLSAYQKLCAKVQKVAKTKGTTLKHASFLGSLNCKTIPYSSETEKKMNELLADHKSFSRDACNDAIASYSVGSYYGSGSNYQIAKKAKKVDCSKPFQAASVPKDVREFLTKRLKFVKKARDKVRVREVPKQQAANVR